MYYVTAKTGDNVQDLFFKAAVVQNRHAFPQRSHVSPQKSPALPQQSIAFSQERLHLQKSFILHEREFSSFPKEPSADHIFFFRPNEIEQIAFTPPKEPCIASREGFCCLKAP